MANPAQDPREGLETQVQAAAKLFLEICRGLEARPVYPGAAPEQVFERFAGSLGDEGVGVEQALAEFRDQVLPIAMGTPHPLYLGLVNCSPFPAAAMADMLVSALNNNGGAFHQSPGNAGAEREVLRRFGALFYGSQPFSGMVVPGGSYANLQGLLMARDARLPQWRSRGPAALSGNPVFYVSEAAHFSAVRAGLVIGVGDADVRAVPTTGRGAMDPQALARAIAADRAGGALPFAVVATAGTTGTGAVDPLAELADICARDDLWLHVDACYGGGALLLEELRDEFAGIERADSVAVDPHKWFFMPLVAGIVLTRHPDAERRAFQTDATYIPGVPGDPFRRGISTSRRSSALAIWMALRAHGWNAVRDAVRRNIQLTRAIETGLAERGFDVMSAGQLSIACARWTPAGLDGNAANMLQSRIAEAVVGTGKAWFSTVDYGDRRWLRLNMVNLYTGPQHVETVVELLAESARSLAPA